MCVCVFVCPLPQFNAIDCQPTNPNACCAVAEADSDSPANGARIECTQNGGATWTTAFFQAGTASSGYSLMEIRYATDDIVFACGGLMGALYPSAWFLSSTDGGTTWTQTTPSTMVRACVCVCL
ncbi:MAG: hypothetical protein P4L40_05060 [Terracidiphilus sp.]|nr:hypothetical protein [Terracidiphilus sp.]